MTPEEVKIYKKNWIAKRRADYFKDKTCLHCGTIENLELDHIDPKQKTCHRIWSWREERRLSEIAKCQILCRKCHQQKTNKDMGYTIHNSSGYRRGCRCDICRKAGVQRVNEWRWRTGRRTKRSGQADIAEAQDC